MLQVVDLQAGDNMKPEYLALNPQHNIPCVKDGEFVGNESRAVAAYLASKYAKDDSLYPKDLETRYKVDQMLFFDMGQFYKVRLSVVRNSIFHSNLQVQNSDTRQQKCSRQSGT